MDDGLVGVVNEYVAVCRILLPEKYDVDAELGFENIKQVSYSLLFFKGEWFAVCSLDFADVGRNCFLLLTLLTLELFDILNFSETSALCWFFNGSRW